MTVNFDTANRKLTVRVDRSKVVSCGKAALRGMLLHLHMYRCTADVQACRAYYEDLSKVDGKYVEWREIVLAQNEPRWVFVQANTFLKEDGVALVEYEPTREGVIQSWVERAV
jgi:dipeptidyl-peptidase-3